MNVNSQSRTVDDAPPTEDYYAELGLSRTCSTEQIRHAYRVLAKRYHPDLNQSDSEARARTQALNAAYEVLSHPARRRSYDRELDQSSQAAAARRQAKIERNIAQDVHLRIDDFLRGADIQVRIKDPANPDGDETYKVEIPAMTAPGAKLRVPRNGSATGGLVQLRLKVLPGFRFKARGSDIRAELRISAQRAAQGGAEMVARPAGGMIRLTIPPRVKRGEILRLTSEGLPKPRGGRGDLLVRISYRPEVRVTRSR